MQRRPRSSGNSERISECVVSTENETRSNFLAHEGTVLMAMQLRKNISAIGFRASLALAILPIASVLVSLAFGTLLKLGPLSQHMLNHIALLGVAAPLSAWTLRNLFPPVTGRVLATATIVQVVLIWVWHLPPVFDAAVHGSALLHAATVASLYGAGLMFWCAILSLADRRLWQAILALLVTGKLFCLFAAVLVFSLGARCSRRSQSF